SSALLPGCTRQAILALAQERRMTIVERAFTIEEACAAAECFFTSATAFVMPVVSLDGRKIGQGAPGEATRRLRELYIEAARASAQ
ncbi:MAG TPA: aminotransferase class IV, partial [Beijerinckiaceae bacterium]|nr:aminotransferase class IV [Beijerinckiaceae bacterium]